MLKKRVPQKLVHNTLFNKKQTKSQEMNTFKTNDKKMNVSFNNINLDTIPTFPEHKTATINLSSTATISVTEGIEIQSNNIRIPLLDLSGVQDGNEIVIIVNANGLQIDDTIMPNIDNPNFTFHLKYYDDNFSEGINDKDNKMDIVLPQGFDSNNVNWVLYTTALIESDIEIPYSENTNAVFVEPIINNRKSYDFTNDTLYFRNNTLLLTETELDISTGTSPLIKYINRFLINTEKINGKDINIYYSIDDSCETYSVDFQNNNDSVNLTVFYIHALDVNENKPYTGMIHWPFNDTINSENNTATGMSSEDFIKEYTTTQYTNGYDENDDTDKLIILDIKKNATLFIFCLNGILFETEKSNEEEDESGGIIVSGHILFENSKYFNFNEVTPQIIYKGNVNFTTYCPILNEQIRVPKCETFRYNKARVLCNVIKGHNDSCVWYYYPLPITSDGTVTQRKEIDKWIINKNLQYTYSIEYVKAEERDDNSGIDYNTFFTDYNVIIQKDEQENGVTVKFHKKKKTDEDVTFDVKGTTTVRIEEGCVLDCDIFKC